MFLSEVVRDFEKRWQDRLRTQLAPTQEREDFVFLGIDEASMTLSALEPEEIEESAVLSAMSQPYPWNRRVWAQTIKRLGDAGARLILIDVFSPGPSADTLADWELEEALTKYRDRIVLASQWSPVDQLAMQHLVPFKGFLGGGTNEYGFVNYAPDWRDDVFRSAQFGMTANEMSGGERLPGEEVVFSFAAVAGRALGVEPREDRALLRFAAREQDGVYQAAQAYPVRSLYTLFGEREWEANYEEGRFFKDKVVIVGPAAKLFHDELKTPSGMIFGAQMHLQALGCLLEDSFWYDAPGWLNWLGLLGMAGVAALLVMKVRSPLVVLGVSVGIAVLWVFGCAYAANASGVLFTGFSGLLGLGLVTVGCEGAEFFFEQKARKKLHRQLSRSVSPDVAEAMVRSPEGYLDAARGGRRTVAVLFSDVRNFTARSEQMEPEALVLQLNAYFSSMVGAVFATKGTIDKFIGDAVMASWGGLLDLSEEEMAESSLAAAEGMLQALDGLNRGWKEVGWEKFEVGIGIHIGEAVVGEIGSRERSDFTAIGDAVNVASRIEGMTKQLGVPLLVSGRVARAVEACLCLLGAFRVKGREEPLEVYTVVGEDLSPWEEALEALRGGGVGGMSALAQGGAFAGPARFYLKWLEQRGGGVPKGWDGVVRLESK
ncbi:MAG: adenylate/guanylate cyclase domain-containing protein [Verrucomicrobia bacterium]|nr:adenylate/guanylate cyclase domain-containing protein [Verrucomicrobiota bacterium]